MESNKNSANQYEIDLDEVYRKVHGTGQKLGGTFKRIYYFFRKYWLLVIPLLIISALLGSFLDDQKKTFHTHVIVSPNFRSADYLYNTIEQLSSKILSNDTVFLKKIGIKKSSIGNITIKPVIDIYALVNENDKNYNLLQLMTEDGRMGDIIKDPVTARNYKYHQITLLSNDTLSADRDVKPILDYLNSNHYFSEIQRLAIQNIQSKIIANDTMIKQIDRILARFSSTKQSGANLIYNNESLSLDDIIVTKDKLLIEQNYRSVELLDFDKTIKERSIVTNIEIQDSFLSKKVILYPCAVMILLIFVGLLWPKHSVGKQKDDLL